MDAISNFLEQFGAWGLFLHSFIDAIFFPIPAFFLQVSLSAVQPETALWLATLGYIGCLLGTPIGYGIGRASGLLLLKRMFSEKRLEAGSALFAKHGEAAILIGSFTPIPFKLFTIFAGCMKYPLWKLMMYAAVGRAVKFYVVGALFYWYGRSAINMVDKRLTWTMLAIAVVLGIVWYGVRRWKSKRQSQTADAAASGGEADSAAVGEASAVVVDGAEATVAAAAAAAAAAAEVAAEARPAPEAAAGFAAADDAAEEPRAERHAKEAAPADEPPRPEADAAARIGARAPTFD